MSDDLHRVAAAFRASLPADALLSVFRIDALDRVGVPVCQAALIAGEEPAVIGYGYGTRPIEAEVGALGELCEEVHVGDWVARAPRVRATYASLRVARGADAVCDPLTLCLPAGSDYAPDMALDWVEARRWPDGAPALVPRDWVAAYGYQLGNRPELITPITNGLGAGFDLPHAVAHGLMELLQRDGNLTSFRALDQGVVVDLDTNLPADVAGLLDGLRAAGIAPLVKLAGTEFGIADLYVVGDDTGEGLPIQITACGEAAHPDRDRALRKALLEFVGSRSRKAATHGPIEALRDIMPAHYAARQMRCAEVEEEEPRALAAMTEWIGADAATLRDRLRPTVFSDHRRVRFSDLPTVRGEAVASAEARCALLTERLAAAGLPILYVDCSPADGGVRVVRTIVPGLESETMSYGRIGWRGVARLRARGDGLIRDEPREGAARVRLRPEDEARAGGPAWFDVALARRIVGPLYPLYREPGPYAAQLERLGRRRPQC